MRIISGKFKGKRLVAPKKLPVRPTTDMAKEGLFNILNNRFHWEEISVLDLFSGTGNVSFEFASRGVGKIIAVDSYAGCIQYINKIAKELDMAIHTIRSDVFKFLERTPEKFDVIFGDPPYNFEQDKLLQIVNRIMEKELLLEDGLLILEHAEQTDLSSHKNFISSRKYGSSVFSFFEK